MLHSKAQQSTAKHSKAQQSTAKHSAIINCSHLRHCETFGIGCALSFHRSNLFNVQVVRHPELVSGSHKFRMGAENFQKANVDEILKRVQDDVGGVKSCRNCTLVDMYSNDAKLANSRHNEISDETCAKNSSRFSLFTSHSFAFTLSEVLITLGIIGVIAAMVIPNLIESSQESQWVGGLLKFNSTLQQAVQLWKQDIGCDASAQACLASQNLSDSDCTSFEQISKFMGVQDKQYGGYSKTAKWLPAQTLKYNGDSQVAGIGGVSQKSAYLCAFLLKDGTTLAVDPNPSNFGLFVDVNGIKPPNRIGKDTFPFYIGGVKGIYYWGTAGTSNATGLCSWGNCITDNVDPNVGAGASPTSYVILNQKIPDYRAIAAKYPGTFKP